VVFHPHLKHTLALAALTITLSLAHAGETTNKIGITMVDIPAGSFIMGSCKLTSDMEKENKKRAFLGQALLTPGCDNPDPDAWDDETPQRRVSIRAFQMSKTEVTLGQFKQFIAAAGRTDLLTDDFMKYNAYGDDAPVVWVSWHDAQDFIKWLNKLEGGGYRLPSEAEWEYACRAGGQHTYCGGNDLNALGWYRDNSGKRPRPVGTKRANAWGLHDMSGNVWEWVQDCYHDSYRGAPSDGNAWTSSCSYDKRVKRGGSWDSYASGARAASRGSSPSVFLSSNYGFRLARDR
jgi:formylglycine-generating enzyme required for sulfatase activity